MAEASFQGKTVVVTGAGRGIGLGIARRFAQAGAHVVVAELDAPAGEAAAEALRGEGGSAVFAPLDVRNPAASQALVQQLLSERGSLDVWVNNAGVWHEGPAESLPRDWWDESVAVMLSGAFYCAQAAGQAMLSAGRGVIVNVAGVDGYQPVEGHAAYSVAKAGLIMLTQALGIEWAARGVRVVGVAPGALMVEVADRVAASDALADVYLRRTPMRRLGRAAEVAEAVLYLASDRAAYVVAETLRVDGGWLAYQLF